MYCDEDCGGLLAEVADAAVAGLEAAMREERRDLKSMAASSGAFDVRLASQCRNQCQHEAVVEWMFQSLIVGCDKWLNVVGLKSKATISHLPPTSQDAIHHPSCYTSVCIMYDRSNLHAQEFSLIVIDSRLHRRIHFYFTCTMRAVPVVIIPQLNDTMLTKQTAHNAVLIPILFRLCALKNMRWLC